MPWNRSCSQLLHYFTTSLLCMALFIGYCPFPMRILVPEAFRQRREGFEGVRARDYYIATMLYCYAERINALQVSGQDKIGISFGLFQHCLSVIVRFPCGFWFPRLSDNVVRGSREFGQETN
jgi:hypothetical protein